MAGPEEAPADRNRAAMTEHANEVIADDNAGTLLAIESKTSAAQCVNSESVFAFFRSPLHTSGRRFDTVRAHQAGSA